MDELNYLRGKLYPVSPEFTPCPVCGFIMGHQTGCEKSSAHIEFVANLTDADFEFLADMRVIV